MARKQWISTWFTCNTAATVYSPLNGYSVTPNATETVTQCPLSESGTVSSISVNLTAAPGGGKSYAFTLYKNGVATTMTTTVSNAATSNVLTGTLSITAGDRLSIEEIPSGAPAAANATVGILFEPNTNDAFVYPCNFPVAGAAPRFNPLFHGTDSDSGSSALGTIRDIAPIAGTITAIALHFQTAPGAGTGINFIVEQNGSEVAASLISINDTNTNALLTGLNIPIAQYDQTAFKYKSNTGSPGDPVFRSYCVTFQPASPGLFFYTSGSSTAFSNSAVNYGPLNAKIAPDTTEANVQLIVPGEMSWRGIAIVVSNGRAGGTSYTMSSRIGAAPGSISVLLDNAAGTQANDFSHSDSLIAGNLIDIAGTPSGTPTTMGAWGYGAVFRQTQSSAGGSGGGGSSSGGTAGVGSTTAFGGRGGYWILTSSRRRRKNGF